MLFQDENTEGLYVGLRVTEQKDIDYLKSLQVRLQHLHNLELETDFHCTLIYSRMLPIKPFKPSSISFTTIGTRIGMLGDCLVLFLIAPELKRYHETLRARYNFSHDFFDYIPHITIAKNITGKLPEKTLKSYKNIKPVCIKLGGEYQEPLDLTK